MPFRNSRYPCKNGSSRVLVGIGSGRHWIGSEFVHCIDKTEGIQTKECCELSRTKTKKVCVTFFGHSKKLVWRSFQFPQNSFFGVFRHCKWMRVIFLQTWTLSKHFGIVLQFHLRTVNHDKNTRKNSKKYRKMQFLGISFKISPRPILN